MNRAFLLLGLSLALAGCEHPAAPASPGPAPAGAIREGENVVRARNVMVTAARPSGKKIPVSLPVVEGPAAQKMMPNLSLLALTGEEENALGDTTESVELAIVFHDPRVLTLSITVYTMGAYPDSHGRTVSLAWSTGARIGSEVFLPGRRSDLARVLDGRVQAAWRAKKAELAKRPSPETSCGPDAVSTFMSGDALTFDERLLDTVHVVADGIAFSYDFQMPHAVAACSPNVDLHLSWDDVRPYLDPSSVLLR